MLTREAAPHRFREAELKHGRVAMLASWGMITQDMWHPLFGGKLSANPLLALVQACRSPRPRHHPTMPRVARAGLGCVTSSPWLPP